MGDFNLNPINPHLITGVANDRSKKERDKDEPSKKKKEEHSEPEHKTTENSTDTFSVDNNPQKPGYSMDWVRINNLKKNMNPDS